MLYESTEGCLKPGPHKLRKLAKQPKDMQDWGNACWRKLLYFKQHATRAFCRTKSCGPPDSSCALAHSVGPCRHRRSAMHACTVETTRARARMMLLPTLFPPTDASLFVHSLQKKLESAASTCSAACHPIIRPAAHESAWPVLRHVRIHLSLVTMTSS